MIHTVKAVRTLQAVACVVGISLFLWSTGLPTMFKTAHAVSIIDASDTLSNSAPNAGSNHTIAFTTPSGFSANQQIVLTFAAGFGLGSIDEDDVDILVNGISSSTASSNGAATWGVATTSTTITFTAPTDMGASGTTTILIRVGLNAVDSGTGNAQITNPSATTTTYAIDIGGSITDSGQVRVAIVDQVTVTANVDTSLTFTVSGVNSSSTVNGSPTTTAATTSSNALPFGNLQTNSSRTLAHDLAVTTNASNGYTVTVEQTGDLQSTTGATIDGFIDGADTVAPTAWQGPGAVIASPDTYGHWGLTSTDGTTTRSLEFGSNQWVAPSTTPIVIMGHDDVADGVTAGVGSARIGYQVQISALQEAGDDYTTTLRYIATPTF